MTVAPETIRSPEFVPRATRLAQRPVKISALCELCHSRKAAVKRPKNLQKLCQLCFFNVFETEIHQTITNNNLYHRGEKLALGASGGKDSTVLAYVMKTLNDRYDYGLDLVLLSIDEGIVGYRDDSLATVKRNQVQYGLPLEIVSYKDLYNWTMDEIVTCCGIRNSCTYCGVLRRQALDRGALKLGINHVVTGHNADDMAETVLMNILRGDLARLEKSTAIITESAGSPVKRSKPFKFTYQKEIVLYAHFKKLDYFSTECTYAPEAFRGTARELMKQLEKSRSSTVIDIIYSGENLLLQPKRINKQKQFRKVKTIDKKTAENGQNNNKNREMEVLSDGSISLGHDRAKYKDGNKCLKCGYLSSNKICKACVLLQTLEKMKPKITIDNNISTDGAAKVLRSLETLSF
ncbi:Ncs6p [Ascoidea rubescens DSM 1968]|uniref:Cytoplasmic tRNA 2-thiolation protein 1 n=1 Tax=Ascoidea rubescens DSM 1968 TaxID=1344418 RepID=A0A1D2VNM5_9ASCO|nr:cytoplasmic tRNA 2-thiolation protein 1 [Ascoidea rubescens DSM 1968]ODV63155.1 cytoplasmic tRNA 2-thiolation protein 1 [Ascoidea rubescens DSM 1968]